MYLFGATLKPMLPRQRERFPRDILEIRESRAGWHRQTELLLAFNWFSANYPYFDKGIFINSAHIAPPLRLQLEALEKEGIYARKASSADEDLVRRLGLG